MRPGSETSRWRKDLRTLAAAHSEDDLRAWAEIVDEAQATAVAATVVGALAATRHPGAHGRDALALGLDALRDPYQGDPMREDLIEALGRFSESYRSMDLDGIVDRLAGFQDASVGGLMNAVQGVMLELRVENLLAQGTLPMPEGAASGELADFTAKSIDGTFLDSEGMAVGTFQVKASRSLEPINEHLAKNPDVPFVYANEEAAELAGIAGLETVHNTGVGLEALLPRIDGELVERAAAFRDEFSTSLSEGAGELASEAPLVALALIGAELAWSKFRGRDMSVALDAAGGRASSAALISAGAWAVSAATGIEQARLVVVVGGKTGQWAISRVDAELAASISRVRQARELLEPLVGA